MLRDKSQQVWLGRWMVCASANVRGNQKTAIGSCYTAKVLTA